VGGLRLNRTLRNLKVEMAKDKVTPTLVPPDDVYVIRRIVSPSDEMIDLTSSELALARKIAAELRKTDDGDPAALSGPPIRRARPATRGLLLLYALDPRGAMSPHAPGASAFADDLDAVMGFAVSFPRDPDAPGIEYAVTNVYWQQEFELA
jgi:hypothetical protein